MKTEIPKEKSSRLINSGNVVLVTSAYKDKINIITLAWKTPLCRKPALIGISVAKTHFSCELIEKSGEFIINIPDSGLLEKCVFCGRVSGRDKNKFKETGLTPVKAGRLRMVPVITECIAHIECYVRDIREIHDHKLFIGEIIYAEAEDEFFKDTWDTDKIKLIYHLGGGAFTTSAGMINV